MAIPALALFYNLQVGQPLLVVSGIVFLAMIGIVAVGTLFSAMAVNTRLAELLVPMLSLPFFVPVLMNAAQAGARIFARLLAVPTGCGAGRSVITAGALSRCAVCFSGAVALALSARGVASADGADGGSGIGASRVLLTSRVATLSVGGFCAGLV